MLFGRIGDKSGRKVAFTAALLTMGIATTAIGLLPAYHAIGVAAPVALTTLRFAQGLGLGGAWGGAAVLVTEAYPKERRGFYGSLVQEASPIGLLVGTGVFSLMTAVTSPVGFESWGWRIPFLISLVLVFVGFYAHRKIEESPLFEELEEKRTESKAPLREIFTTHWKQLLIAVGARFGSDATFYVFGLFALVYLKSILHLPQNQALAAVVAGGFAQLLGIPLFGWLADRIGRRPVLMMGAAGCIVWAFVYFHLLGSSNPVLVVSACFIGLFAHAATWAPIAAYLSELFDTRVRYSGTAVGFQLAAVIGGAIAPLIAVSFAATLPNGLAVSIYVAVIMLVGLITVALARETRGRSFHAK